MNDAAKAFLFICCAGAGACAPDLPRNEPVYLQINNLEQANPANNLTVPGYAAATGVQGNWGLLTVPAVLHGTVVVPNVEISNSGSVFLIDDGPGGSTGQITGIYYGIQITGATTSTGGTMDLFWNAPNATYVVASCMSGMTCAPDAAAVGLFTSGTFLARLKLASGVDPANSGTFTKRDVAFTSNAFGHAESFANVDTTKSGKWTAALDGDWYTTPFGTRDIRLSTTFSAGVASWSGNPAGTVGLRSNDPFRVFTH